MCLCREDSRNYSLIIYTYSLQFSSVHNLSPESPNVQSILYYKIVLLNLALNVCNIGVSIQNSWRIDTRNLFLRNDKNNKLIWYFCVGTIRTFPWWCNWPHFHRYRITSVFFRRALKNNAFPKFQGSQISFICVLCSKCIKCGVFLRPFVRPHVSSPKVDSTKQFRRNLVLGIRMLKDFERFSFWLQSVKCDPYFTQRWSKSLHFS